MPIDYVDLIDQLKDVLPNSPAAQDAVNLVDLLLEARNPPVKFAALQDLLGRLCPLDDEPHTTAEQWRAAAAQVCELLDHTHAAHMLELGLYELALLVDPTPSWQMFSINLHLKLIGLPAVDAEVEPLWIDFTQATGNSFDIAYVRLVVQDRLRSVRMQYEHAAGSLRQFSGWTQEDRAQGSLATRMTAVDLQVGRRAARLMKSGRDQ